jgi:hypothetical protein
MARDQGSLGDSVRVSKKRQRANIERAELHVALAHAIDKWEKEHRTLLTVPEIASVLAEEAYRLLERNAPDRSDDS